MSNDNPHAAPEREKGILLVKLGKGQEIDMRCIAVKVRFLAVFPPPSSRSLSIRKLTLLLRGAGSRPRTRQMVPLRRGGIRIRSVQQVAAYGSVV